MRVDFYGCRNFGFFGLDHNLHFRENWRRCTAKKRLEELIGLLWNDPMIGESLLSYWNTNKIEF